MEGRGEPCKAEEDLVLLVKVSKEVTMSGEEGVRCEREANLHLGRKNGEYEPR